MRLAPLDRWTLGYLAFATVMLLSSWRSRPPGEILAAYALLAAVALDALAGAALAAAVVAVSRLR